MKRAIVNARTVCKDRVMEGGTCVFENGSIVSVGESAADFDEVIDAHGAYLIPGFVDIHCHGGMGRSFMGGDEAEFSEMGIKLISRPLISENTPLARHDPDKLADVIMSIYRGEI